MHQNPDSNNSSNFKEAQRERLLRKLNCLIAVLQVAIGKVRRNLEEASANQQRLLRIRGNLENTLGICRKAKASLEQSNELPSELPLDLDKIQPKDVEEKARDTLRPRPQAEKQVNKMNSRR